MDRTFEHELNEILRRAGLPMREETSPGHLRYLYHGTSSRRLDKIKKAGMKAGTFWTIDPDTARHWADYAVVDAGGKAVVIELPFSEFDQSAFAPDRAMWHEWSLGTPITPSAESKPERTWQNSIRLFGSVFYGNPISAVAIRNADVS